MSKIGLGRRAINIANALKALNPIAWGVHHLSPDMRQKYDNWRARCERLTSNYSGNRYEALLNGERITPPMPPEVSAALGIDPYLAIVTRDRSMDEIQERWTKMLEEE